MRLISTKPAELFKTFGPNATGGRDLIVGDVHGCFTKLRAALEAAGFDGTHDRLFSVGDLVDRGPDCTEVLEWLAKPWFHAIAGNHEAMLIEYAAGMVDAAMYAMNGGSWFIGMTPAERVPFVDALAALPLGIELVTPDGIVALVHAQCPRESWREFKVLALHPEFSDQMQMCAQWSRDRISMGDRADVSDVRAVVVGHAPVERYTSLGNTLFIDTGAWLQGGSSSRAFTILDAATLKPVAAPVPALEF